MKRKNKTIDATDPLTISIAQSDLRRQVMDATQPLTFELLAEDCLRAVRGDPGRCVVGVSLLRRFGDMLEGVQVGTEITKIYLPGRIIRYGTPGKIGRAIPVFDKTGKWELPPGQYTLLVPTSNTRLTKNGRIHGTNRWRKIKYSGGKQDQFKARNLPTRRVKRVSILEAR